MISISLHIIIKATRSLALRHLKKITKQKIEGMITLMFHMSKYKYANSICKLKGNTKSSQHITKKNKKTLHSSSVLSVRCKRLLEMLSVGTKEVAMLALSVTPDNRQPPTQLQRQWRESDSVPFCCNIWTLCIEAFCLPRCWLAGLLASLAAKHVSAKDAWARHQ